MDKKTETVIKPVLTEENLTVSLVSKIPLQEATGCPPVDVRKFEPEVLEELTKAGMKTPAYVPENSSTITHPSMGKEVLHDLTFCEEGEPCYSMNMVDLKKSFPNGTEKLERDLGDIGLRFVPDDPDGIIIQHLMATNESNPYTMSNLFNFTAEPSTARLLRYNLVLDMIQKLPTVISARMMLYPNSEHVIKGLKVKSIFNTMAVKHSVLNTVPISESFGPFIFYLGYSPSNNLYTKNVSYTGIRQMYEQMVKDVEEYYCETGELVRFEAEQLDQMLEDLLNNHSDLSLYDNNISLDEAIMAYGKLGSQYRKHKDGQDLFETYLNDSELEFSAEVVNIDNDLVRGYLNNKILLIPDCVKNHVRVYLLDPSITDVFDYKTDDWKNSVVECVDIEYGDDILKQLSYVVCGTYARLFHAYNSEDTSMDV